MSRKTRLVISVLLVAALFGWRYWRDHHRGADEAPPTKAAATAAKDASRPEAPPPERTLGRVAFTPCTLAPQFGTGSVEAQCGHLSVPENPAAPDGRRIDLALAWIPADEGADVAPDPVFMLAGGPGQSALDTYPQVAPAFREVLKHRNVILVDQRGTGGSNRLDCKRDDDAGDADDGTAEPAAEDAPAVAQTAEGARRQAERCRDRLSKRADLRFYTTTDAVRDLDAVREAIGAEQIDLLGISYGTRVAQQYALRHPDRTRALVLDSVAPNSLILGNDFARNLEHALDLQFAQCEKTPACVEALGHPRKQLDALMATLRSDPPMVRYRDASTGESRQERLTADAVAGLMRMYAYIPLASSLLPLQISEASHGRYEGLAALSRMLGSDVGDAMAMGMQLSVVCSEDAFGFAPDPDAEGSLLGNQLSEFLGAQCAVWPRGAMPADFHQPLRSDVPALVLEGELDPVTPPRYGEEVVKTLPKGRLLVLKGQGHNVIGAGCMPKLFAEFLATTDAKALDAGCLDTLAYVPPFVSFSGWEP